MSEIAIAPRVVIAPDKFKGCLTAEAVARAIADGVLRAAPGASIDLAPVADGGEGTVETLLAAMGGEKVAVEVAGPLGEPREATFGILADGRTAVMEMAEASGLRLVPRDRRDPGAATTRGTGDLIRAALDRGASRIILGIGGSATNDGGLGMAQALGVEFLDAEGRPIGGGGLALERLASIDAAGLDPRLGGVEMIVACDVDNPLCGPRGASAVYGPQKGADPALVERLDRALANLDRVIRRDLGKSVGEVPGAGAAGGLGAGLMAFAGAKLRPGAEMLLGAIGLADRLAGADLCISGEGALDASTAYGKVVAGVAGLAEAAGVPLIALAGSIGEGADAVHARGVAAYFGIAPGPITLDESVARAAGLLERAAEQAMRAFLAGWRIGTRHHVGG